MTVTFRGLMLAVGAAALNVFAAEGAVAQSFYEAITAVARTEVPKRNKVRRASKPDESAPKESAGEENVSVSPIKQTAAGQARPMVTKEDGYRYVPEADRKSKDWPNSEIQIARARCQFILKHIAAEVVPMAPIKSGDCGDPAPVKLISVGSKPKVTFDPPALVNCDMVESLHDWIVKDLQPSARRHLNSPITTIETMSSYSCRNAYGRKNARLSQHARANAIDIRGFRTAKKQKARLMAHWGPTQRAIKASRLAAAKREAEAKAKATKLAARAARESASQENKIAADAAVMNSQQGARPAEEMVVAAPAEPTVFAEATMPRFSFRPSFLDSLGGAGQTALGVAPSKLGGPALSALQAEPEQGTPSWPVVLASDKIDMSQASKPRARFLRDAHRTACRLFGTVLGPEANHAHRNHFHVDLARRDLGNFCR